MRRFVALLLFSFSFSILLANDFTVRGKIIDQKDHSPLIGVNIILSNTLDTLKTQGTSTDVEGDFSFALVDSGEYLLTVSYISYQTIQKNITIKNNVDLPEIAMKEDSKLLKEVVIEDKQVRVQQLGDTSQYNANAFKVNSDASTEDLLQKMPGVTSENGTVKVNGEEVKKILIDGRQFFGDDTRTAVQNIPADIVDKIQVFDKLSDQSQFTGFDDGNSQKTINIITKNGITNSKFGKFYAGYGGPNNRYSAGLNYSAFKGDRRFTILAMSNNINQQNFNIQDLIGSMGSGNDRQGAGGRGGPGRNSSIGNFLVGQQNGIATTSALGLNYSNKIGKQKKVTLSGSYFFNGSLNENNSASTRNYISSNDSGLVYKEDKDIDSKNFNNRLNFKIEYAIDSSNALTFTPSISTQNYISTSNLLANNFSNTNHSSSNTENKQHSKSFGINFSNDILYQHKFNKKGRTISTNLNTVVNSKANTASLYALNTDRIDTLIATDTLDQKSTLYALSYTIGGNIVYTEPIKKNGQIAINFTPSFTRSTSDKNTNNFDLASDSYSITDSILSNHFINKYITNKIGITYRYNDNKKLSWSIGISGQSALLKNEVIDFTATPVSRHFLSVLPNADLNYKFSKTENLRFFYRTSNNPPSIAQLQNVIDNSNSLILTSGNEMLKQNFSQTIGIRYSRANTAKATNFFLFTNATNTINYIANATTIFSRDTIIQGVKMNAGTQFIQPVNLNGYWNVRTFLTYGFPITKMKSNMNVNAGFVYLRTPTLINMSKNIANAYTLNAGITLSSNISKKIDFTLSYHANYNIVRNTLQRINNANYYNHTATARFNYQFWKGFVFNTSVSNTLNAGGSSNYNTSYWLLNASLAYKFLKDESLEVKFSANDILNQNKNITRNVTEVYVEDIQSTALRRYFMGTITYSLRKLGTGNADADKPKDFMLLPPPSGMPPPPGH